MTGSVTLSLPSYGSSSPSIFFAPQQYEINTDRFVSLSSDCDYFSGFLPDHLRKLAADWRFFFQGDSMLYPGVLYGVFGLFLF